MPNHMVFLIEEFNLVLKEIENIIKGIDGIILIINTGGY